MIGYYCITKEKPKNKVLRWSIIMTWDIIGLYLAFQLVTWISKPEVWCRLHYC